MIKRLLIISHNYPSEDNKHTFGFVHSRAKIYKKHLIKTLVYVPADVYRTYHYEGIQVYRGRLDLLRRLVNEFEPDVIAIHAPTPKLLRTTMVLGCPIAVWIHGAEVLFRSFHHYLPPFGLKNNLLKIYMLFNDFLRNEALRLLLNNIHAVIYVSNWMKKMSEHYLRFSHPNSFVIPNPIDTTLFKPVVPMEERPRICISVRALEWKYGVDIAVRAFSRSPVKLTLIGKGSLEPLIKRLIYETKANVELITTGVNHGSLPLVYNRHALFVSPSRTEAQGVAMCEAMASGVPAIATSVDGIPEFVIDHYNGILIRPEDPIELRRAVLKLIHDEAHLSELSRNARKFVETHLSEEIIYHKEILAMKVALSEFK